MTQPTSNDDQIAYWNETAGPKWVRLQEALDAQIAPFGHAVFERAAIGDGHAVLDIGCGCGQTSLHLAQRVGPNGRVTGADISAPMLDHARTRAADLRHAEFIQADVQVHPFAPATYDHAVSRFGIMFFADPAAAFTNIRGALRPGGRLTFVCWRAMTDNPWMMIPLMAAAQHIPLPEPPPPHSPGPFAFQDADRLRNLLEQAGFTNIDITPHDIDLPIGATADLHEATDFAHELGPVSKLLETADAVTSAAVHAAIRDALAPHHGDTGVLLTFATWLVTAQNPA